MSVFSKKTAIKNRIFPLSMQGWLSVVYAADEFVDPFGTTQRKKNLDNKRTGGNTSGTFPNRARTLGNGGLAAESVIFGYTEK